MKEITFEDIQKANASIVTTDIKGKDYAEVNQRIKAFRMVYPTGMIETELVSNENGVCIFRAYVGYRDEMGNAFKLATGTAYEKENSTFINKTSYIENCETSAIGRALGIAGFGIDTSVASADEVGNAIAQQDAMKTVTPIQLKTLQEMIKGLGDDAKPFYDNLLATYNVQDLKDLTGNQYGQTMLEIKKIKEGK